jgi:hypothetical protein
MRGTAQRKHHVYSSMLLYDICAHECGIHAALSAFMLRFKCAPIERLCTAFSDHDAFMRTDVVKQHARVNMMFALSRAAHSIGFKSASPAQNARLLFGQSDMP